MLSFFRKLRRDKRGNVLVLAAAAMPLVVGSAGLATDTIQWALWKRQLQRAADSAAIAGVRDRLQSADTAGVEAAVLKDLEINQHTGIALHEDPVIDFPEDTGEMTLQVKVEVAIQKRLTFTSMFIEPPVIKATATAAAVPGAGDYCVVSLEHTTAMGIEGSGNGSVETDCSWVTNSCATVAAMAKGSSTIYADVIAACGGIQESDNFHVNRYDPYAPPVKDPYAELNPDPDDFECAKASVRERGEDVERTITLTEDSVMSQFFGADGVQTKNCFAGISVGSNRTLTLPPGVYYIDGGNIDIQGTLVGEGVTLVLTNSSTDENAPIGNFNANAKGNVRLTAPTEGKWAGMAIYQDRRAQDPPDLFSGSMPANSPNKINGNSVSYVTGVIYFPNQQITYNGNGDGAWRCTQLVARRIQFSGNNRSRLTTDEDICEGTGVESPEGTPRVRLIA